MLPIHRLTLCIGLFGLTASACRDPEAEAALLAGLDVADDAADTAADAADAGSDVADTAADVADTAADAADIAADVADTAADVADTAADAADTAADAADIAADAEDIAADVADIAADAADMTSDVADTGSDVADIDLCAGVACTDKLPCQTGVCAPATGKCVYTEAAETVSCSDGDPCTVGDMCNAGACVPGQIDVCDDSNDCTTDNCVTGAGCAHVNNTTDCNDANACTTGESCTNGVCGGGAAVSCDDGNACTTDSCALASGCTSTSLPDDTTCGTGQYCLAAKCSKMSCGDGTIQAFLGEQCDDGNAVNGDGCENCQLVPCGNAVCEGGETVYSCPQDCLGLAAHFGGPCTTPGSKDTCSAGYFCVATNGGNVCVADFDTWPPIPDSHPASDFAEYADHVTDLRTGLSWAKTSLPATDWATALTVCTSQTTAGSTDWRLPTRAELLSLLDLTQANPASSAPNFNLPDQWSHWSAVPSLSGGAWGVSFGDGHVGIDGVLTHAYHVRCVRGGATVASAATARFVLQDGGATVLDRVTGLHWQPGFAPTLHNGTDASAVCSANAAGLPGAGWRLPTVAELYSLVDTQRANPATSPLFSGDAQNNAFWSASAAATLSTDWAVAFTDGNSAIPASLSATGRVRCVRDCDGDCSAICGDGVCNGLESLTSCPADCGFLAAHLAGTCANPGSQDTCPHGYVCVAQTGAGNVCVADFDAWAPLPVAQTASDFKGMFGVIVEDNRTGLAWGATMQGGKQGSAASSACPSSAIAGIYTRLPSAAELASLIDFTTTSPSSSSGLDFSNGLTVWTASHFSPNGGNFWQVNFQDGELQYNDQLTTAAVACVWYNGPSSPSSGIGARFISAAGGTAVFDRISGLHWLQTSDGGVNWAGAKAFCDAQAGGWRLPTVVELRSLIDRSGVSPTIDSAFVKPPYQNYWTSTVTGGSAWIVDFYEGKSNGALMSGAAAARCVR